MQKVSRPYINLLRRYERSFRPYISSNSSRFGQNRQNTRKGTSELGMLYFKKYSISFYQIFSDVEFGPCRGGAAVNPSPGAMASPAAPVPSTPSLVVLHFVETLDGWNSELRQLPVMAPILSMND